MFAKTINNAETRAISAIYFQKLVSWSAVRIFNVLPLLIAILGLNAMRRLASLHFLLIQAVYILQIVAMTYIVKTQIQME